MQQNDTKQLITSCVLFKMYFPLIRKLFKNGFIAVIFLSPFIVYKALDNPDSHKEIISTLSNEKSMAINLGSGDTLKVTTRNKALKTTP